MTAEVKVTQVRSAKGADGKQIGALRSLRLGKIGRTATHADSSALRGQLRTVDHLVKLEEPS